MTCPKILLLFLIIFPALFHAADTKVISVLYFNNTTQSKEYGWLTKGLPDMLTTGLSQSGSVNVVEREDLQRVLNEQKLALAGLADEKSAIRVGKLLNANYLIRGSFIIQGNNVRIDARIIDTETGAIKSAEQSGTADGIFTMVKDLTGKLLIQLLLTPRGGDVRVGTSSLDAARLYYQGLELLDSTNVGLAIEKFNQSRAADPFYARPQMGLEEAYKFLKDFKKLRQQRELRELFDQFSAFQSRMREKPFRTYADLIKGSDWAGMSQEERDRFNQKNIAVIQSQSPAQAAWMAQGKLLEITGRNYNLLSEKWNEIEQQFDAKEKVIKDRQSKETWEIHNRKIDLVTNKSYGKEELEKLKKDLEKYSDEIDKKQDAEEKELDAEEKRLDDGKKADDKELERTNLPFLTQMVAIAEAGRTDYRNDSFLPEVLYMELLAFREMKDHTRLKDYSERFLLDYPKYRMIEAVEDFYKSALDKLKDKQ